MNLPRHRAWLALLALVLAVPGFATETNSTADADVAYTSAITERADKIVDRLGLADSAKAARVRDIIIRQYRDLNTIHTERDVKIKSVKAATGSDKDAVAAAVQAAYDETKPYLDKLHGEFLARLSAELSPEQVDKVKDGLTYGVLPLTYGVYLKMYPHLTDEQKRQIMTWLIEAREIAMDGSTSDEKHAVFGKYKGRINNYLSKAGYDAKQGGQNLRKPSQPRSETKAD